MSFVLKTTVKDMDTLETLPGATVFISDANGKAVPVNGVASVGRKTDANGYFILPIAHDDAYITISYVGYQTISHPADDYKNDVIYLKRKAQTAKEVIVRAKRMKPTAGPTITYKKKKHTNWWLISAAIGVLVVTGIIIYKIFK